MKLALVVLSSILTVESKLLGAQTRAGSYWFSYPNLESTPSECNVESGVKVPDSCCTADQEIPLRSDFTPNTCSNMLGFLPDDPSLGLVNYLNCDDGAEVYAEGCFNGGVNGGIVPAGAYESNNATSLEECGTNPPCLLIVKGKGCWRIRDVNDLPGYEDDPAQVFLWLDIPTCMKEEESAGGLVGGQLAWMFVALLALLA